MPESEKTEAEVTAEAEATAAAEVATKEAEAQAATAKEAEDKASADATALDAEKVAAAAKDAELPEWARAELTRVRNEAAASRISLRDATAKFEGAKTPEEFAAAVAEIQAENVRLTQDLARTTVGTKYKLPPELVAVLTGDTPEALDAHAKLLSKFVTAEEVDPETLSGGLTPDGTNGAFDPVAEARKARLSRY